MKNLEFSVSLVLIFIETQNHGFAKLTNIKRRNQPKDSSAFQKEKCLRSAFTQLMNLNSVNEEEFKQEAENSKNIDSENDSGANNNVEFNNGTP